MKVFKHLALSALIIFSSFAIMGCKVDAARTVEALSDAYTAETLSEQDAQEMGRMVAEKYDQENKISSSNSKYSQRLAKLTAPIKSEDGLKLNFKVYETNDINAFALPDGSVRIFSALMDLMDDDELFFIIGHEMGHVKNKDSFNRMKTAYRISAIRKAAGATHSLAAGITDSQLGGLATKYVEAQYSQSQESAADSYGAQLMKKHNKPIAAGASGLRKLGDSGGGAFASHPNSLERADKIDKMK